MPEFTKKQRLLLDIIILEKEIKECTRDGFYYPQIRDDLTRANNAYRLYERSQLGEGRSR